MPKKSSVYFIYFQKVKLVLALNQQSHLYAVLNDQMSFDNNISCRFTYDYEEDKLWLPRSYSKLVKIINRFNTTKLDDIVKDDSSIPFLISLDIGEMKHNKFEFDKYKTIEFSSVKSVYIVDGEFTILEVPSL